MIMPKCSRVTFAEIALGKPTTGLQEIEALHRHDEVDYGTAMTAGEALKAVRAWSKCEGRPAVIVAGQSAQSAATPVQPKAQLGRDRGDRNSSNAFDVNTHAARSTADMIVCPTPATATASYHVAPGRGLTVRAEYGLPHSPADVRYCPTLPPF